MEEESLSRIKLAEQIYTRSHSYGTLQFRSLQIMCERIAMMKLFLSGFPSSPIRGGGGGGDGLNCLSPSHSSSFRRSTDSRLTAQTSAPGSPTVGAAASSSEAAAMLVSPNKLAGGTGELEMI